MPPFSKELFLEVSKKLLEAFRKYDEARDADPFLIDELIILDNRTYRGIARKFAAMKPEDFAYELEKNNFLKTDQGSSSSRG